MNAQKLRRAELLLENGQYELGIQAFRDVLADSPDNSYAHASLGWCLTKCDRLDEGESHVLQAIRLEPDSDYAHQLHAKILSIQEKLLEAEAAVLRAIAIDPNFAHYRCLHANILRKQEQCEAAIAAAEVGLRLSPEDVGCVLEKMLAQVDLDDFPAANATIRIALRLAPENSNAHAALGYSLLRREELAGAASAFRESLRLAPHNQWAQYGLRRCRIQRFPWYRWANGFRLETMSSFAAHMYGIFTVVILVGVSLYLYLPPPTSPILIELPLLLFFPPILATCAIEPTALWVLSFDREGKQLLLPLQKRIADVIVLLTSLAILPLAAGTAALCGKLAMDAWPLFMLALAVGAPIPPLAKYCDCKYGRPRQVMRCLIGGVAATSLFAALVAIGAMIGWLDVSWNYSSCTALVAVMLPTLVTTLYLTGYRLTD